MSEDSEVDSEMDVSAEDPAALESFRNDVLAFLTLPEQIKEREEPVKQLKTQKKELQHSISSVMTRQDIKKCAIPVELGGGNLVVKVVESKTAVKKENWEKGFDAFCKKRKLEDATFEELLDLVEETRETTTKTSLKRVGVKKPRSKKQ